MNGTQKVQYLVVDTSAFIQNAPLQTIGVNIITEQDVVNEITNKRQLRRLVVLPYDLTIQNAYSENITFVTEFAKKTGDYTSLSATDIKVLALTYQLEKEKVGINHLRTMPIITQTISSNIKEVKGHHTSLAGFYMPEEKKNVIENTTTHNNCENAIQDLLPEIKKLSCELIELPLKKNSNYKDKYNEYEHCKSNDGDEHCKSNDDDEHCKSNDDDEHCKSNDDDEYCKSNDDDEHCKSIDDDDDDDDDDDVDDDDNDENDDNGDDDNDNSGWITPGNIYNIKKEYNSDFLEQTSVTVACLTMDFAMQNVLKQIGLNMVSLDGRIIKQMRTYIFRCYACYKTTSIMTKIFCPNCGNKTLKKVGVTIDQHGKQKIHINFRKPISKKGKRFSLPMPQGGKHANNPLLCEDYPVPDQRPSRLARTKNNPLQDDHIAEYSPFIMRDVHSKSALLGIRSKGPVKYWMRKNPNEVRRKRK